MCTEKNKPHVHAELIKAWADGAKIQYKSKEDPESAWDDCVVNPAWSTSYDYRIKPIPKVKKYLFAYLTSHTGERPVITISHYESIEEYKSYCPSSKFAWVERIDASVIEM